MIGGRSGTLSGAGLYGMPVALSLSMSMTETVTVREWPKDRFIEYEDGKDDAHGRFMGWVRDEVRPSGNAVRVGQTWVMHPALWERFKAAIATADMRFAGGL